ncbi:MAG: restriction endonuclease subunit S [Parabacteroides sp.]
MKEQTNNIGGIPFYKIGTFGNVADAYISRELYEDYKGRFSFPIKGEILISASGTIGRTVIYDGKDAYFQDSNIVWIHNDESKVLNRYLYHYYQIIEWNVEGGTIKRLYNNNLAKTKIAVPDLAEQERIVSILDKFEALTNDLSQGLPAEIAAVQEQYEYYRDKLLSFPRNEKISA